jgi:hypothetical protein
MEITKKIHRLDYRFSKVFFLKSQTFWQKSQDFWFADFFLAIFKIHKLVWIFGCFECVSSMFCLNFITNLKFYKRCFIKDNFQKHFCIIGWCLVRQRNR